MNDDVIKRAFERIAQLRAEGKLPQITPEDYENEPTALAFTDFNKISTVYSESEVDELVYSLINRFLNWNGSYVDNEKLKEFYQELKQNNLDL